MRLAIALVLSVLLWGRFGTVSGQSIDARVAAPLRSTVEAEAAVLLASSGAPVVALFEYLEAVCAAHSQNNNVPSEVPYTAALQAAEKRLTSSRSALLRAQLASRAEAAEVDYTTSEVATIVGAEGVPTCAAGGFLRTVDGQIACTGEDLDALLLTSKPADDAALKGGLRCSSKSDVVVEVYSSVSTPGSCAVIRAVKQRCESGALGVLHPRFFTTKTSGASKPAVFVPGFGATVDLKNMEYKAVDDRKKEDAATASDTAIDDSNRVVGGVFVKRLAAQYPALRAGLEAFETAMESRSSPSDFKVWEIQNLGVQTVASILSASNPLEATVDILHNFPARVGRLSKSTVDQGLHQAILGDAQLFASHFGDGSEAKLMLFGRPLTREQLDLFSILRIIKNEYDNIDAVATVIAQDASEKAQPAVDIDAPILRNAATALLNADVQSGNREGRLRFWLDQSKFTWLNDIEKDQMYASLNRNVREYLMPSYYGQPRFARRNAFNIFLVLNALDRDGLQRAANILHMLEQGVALRIGVMFVLPSAAMEAGQKLLTGGPIDADGTIKGVDSSSLEGGQDGFIKTGLLQHISATAPDILVSLISAISAGAELVNTIAQFAPEMSKEQLYTLGETTAEATRAYFTALGHPLDDTVAFFNGEVIEGAMFDRMIYGSFNYEFMWLRQQIHTGQITNEDADMYGKISELRGAMKRYHPKVLGEKTQWERFASPGHARILKHATWIFGPEFDYETVPVGHLLRIASFTAENGLAGKAIEAGLNMLDGCLASLSCATRLAILPCDDSAATHVLRTALVNVGRLSEKKRLARLKEFTAWFVPSIATLVQGSIDDGLNLARGKFPALLECDAECASSLRLSHADCSAALTGVHPEQAAVFFSNGRVTPFDAALEGSDLRTLTSIEAKRRANALLSIIVEHTPFVSIAPAAFTGDDMTSEFYANKVFAVQSVVASIVEAQGAKLHGTMPSVANSKAYFDVVSGATESAERALFDVVAVVDPTQRSNQKLISLIKYLVDTFKLPTRIYLFAAEKVNSVSIKNYYRFVAPSEMEFDPDGVPVAPHAVFKNLPKKSIMTLGIDEPETWLLFASEAAHDLDNIKLEEGSVRAIYEIHSLVLSGSCVDENGTPPQGLPLVMTRAGSRFGEDAAATAADERRDTLVMSNLGYFQFHVTPGQWAIHIDAGRPREVFALDSVNERPPSTIIQVRTLNPAGLNVVVKRLKHEALFPADGAGENRPWPHVVGDQPARPAKPTLNVLSLASGHLYERFLRMMMHTVMNASYDKHGVNTTRVKFWLIENPTSPKFRAFIPKMAKEYGFEYEFVRYKWPAWLRRQTEKQRQIWAYKVLFLDVLFPLDVEKVIFVDADQIVNADLHELYNLDIQNHAVAYTPFCRKNAREETKGFRFWDSGYWSDYLRDKPYHISAIYLVDLARFRRQGVGDRYRVIYENLSADPNSLANLDQDLPNYAQYQVPIFHLPEEWLWCETWCSDASKVRAKTIDLCNNPKTKTPKLENARRVVPFWDELDANLTAFEKRVTSQ